MARKRLYSVEVMICATAYIMATSEDDALAQANGLKHQSPAIQDSGGEVPVSGLRYDDPRLPPVSLSPAMTIHGAWPGASPDIAE